MGINVTLHELTNQMHNHELSRVWKKPTRLLNFLFLSFSAFFFCNNSAFLSGKQSLKYSYQTGFIVSGPSKNVYHDNT